LKQLLLDNLVLYHVRNAPHCQHFITNLFKQTSKIYSNKFYAYLTITHQIPAFLKFSKIYYKH